MGVQYKKLIILFLVLSFQFYLSAVAQICPEGGPQTGSHGSGGTGGNGGVEEGIEWFIRSVHSSDPNEIQGPRGFGEKQVVSVKDKLKFTVRFENDPKIATAPAQNVFIHVPVDPRININTLQLSGIGFGNFNFTVPENSSFYSTRLDVKDSLGLYVDFTAGIDITKHEIFWIFKSIDPATGQPPTNALIGFLPVNDTTINRFNDTIPKIGEGYVSYLIAPKKDLVTGDSVAAKAAIIFDTNETIPTNTWTNIIDAVAPVSQVSSFTVNGDTITVHWSGQDDAMGSGVRDYALYVAESGGTFTLFKNRITESFTTFVGTPGVSYQFFSLATDNVGNQETLKKDGEASVTVTGVAPVIAGLANQSICQNTPGPPIAFTISDPATEADDILLTASSSDTTLVANRQIMFAGTGMNRTLVITPNAGKTGETTIVIKARNRAGVTAEISFTLTVLAVPTVTASPDLEVSLKSPAFLLAGALPAGGTYSGPGVSEGKFDPAVAGIGTHTLTYTVTGENGCNNSITQTITVGEESARLSQTITFSEISPKTFGEAPFALIATASSGLPVSFTIVSGPATVSSNTLTLTGAGTVVVSAAQGGDARYLPAPEVSQSFVVSEVNTWTGAISTDWNLAGNWSPGVPTATTNALIPAGLRWYPTLDLGNAEVKNLTLAAGGQLTLSGGTLTISGDLINNGFFTHSNGTVTFNGAIAQTLSGSSLTTFFHLTIGSQGLALATDAAVKGLLTLEGNLSTHGHAFTLLSGAGASAMVYNNGGVVVGQATMQRAISPVFNSGTGLHHLSSPVKNATVADLEVPGKFIPIVNPNYNVLPTPAAASFPPGRYPTVFEYDGTRITSTYNTFETGWKSPLALSQRLERGQGFNLIIAPSAVVALTGTLNNGDVAVNLSRSTASKAGYNLIGNPYPSPLDWNLVRAANPGSMTDKFYDGIWVWKATGLSSGTYQTYINGLGTLQNGIIPAMQGFLVWVNDNTNFTFRNSYRVTSYVNPAVYRQAPEQRPTLQLALTAAGDTVKDETIVYFQKEATAEAEHNFDAGKLPAVGQAWLYTLAGLDSLAVNGLPEFTQPLTVPLGVEVPVKRSYTFTANELLNFSPGTRILLEDKLTGTRTALISGATYTFTATHKGSQGDRFLLRFNPAGTEDKLLASHLLVYPNPSKTRLITVEMAALPQIDEVQLTVTDVLGRKVMSKTVAVNSQGLHESLHLERQAAGTYVLQLKAGKSILTRKLILE